ncbi:hypothetical protein CsSME_00035550 [Camellia sinensis var. sinensis]
MAVATTVSAIVSSPTVRRRLPFVGAFCILSLGISNLCSPSLSLSSSNTPSAYALSLPLSLPLSRSKFSSQTPANSNHGIKMEANNKTVPSIVVYVTVPNKEAGKKLAESIVKAKLAACVNRVPVTSYKLLVADFGFSLEPSGIESVYEWKGEVQTDSEELLIIKTRESLLEALTAHVKANHEYEVPEVIAMPIVGGSIPYLEWLKNSTRD